MIQCCSDECSVQWYHCECIGSTPADVADDWWCSDACAQSGSYIYCICKRSTAENTGMIQCELAGECAKHEWYHPSCLCAKAELLPGLYCHLCSVDKIFRQDWHDLWLQTQCPFVLRCMVLLGGMLANLQQGFPTWSCVGIFQVPSVARFESPRKTWCDTGRGRSVNVATLVYGFDPVSQFGTLQICHSCSSNAHG